MEELDRRLVLRQVRGLLGAGGLAFSASISRLGILGDLMARTPESITRAKELESVLTRGRDPETP